MMNGGSNLLLGYCRRMKVEVTYYMVTVGLGERGGAEFLNMGLP